MSILTSTNKPKDISTDSGGYSDLDLTFKAHPITGDLMINTGNLSVTKAMKNLLLTNHYEKLFSPNYGSNINKLLFEPMTPFTASTLSSEITYTIRNYEPRVTLSKVDVIADYDNNAYQVSIEYYIKNLIEPFTLNFLLNRLR